MAEAKQVDFLLSGLCNSSGTPLADGEVYFYETDGVTFKDIWEDSGATVTAANPVILDSRGTAVIFAEGVYDVVIKDSSGATLSTPDGLSYDRSSEAGEIEASDYGDLTGATIATAMAVAAGDDATVVLSPGNWLVTDNLTIPANINLKFLFGAYLTISTTKTVTYNGILEAPPFNIHRGAGTVVFSTKNPIILTIWKISAVQGNVAYTGTHSFENQLNAVDLTVSKATPILHITSSTDTRANLAINGGITSDAVITLQRDSNTIWTFGHDYSATSNFVIAASAALGTTNYFSINSGTGVITGLGSGLTGLDAGNISSGTLPLVRGGTGASLVTVNNATFVTSGGGVVSLSTTLPSDVQLNITTLGNLTSNFTVYKATPIISILSSTDTISTFKIVGGASTDSAIELSSNSATPWTFGRDSSDSNAFVISNSTDLGTSNRLKITTAGVISGDGSGLTALNATNLSSGTIDSARVSGSYTGITAVGTLTSLTVSGNLSLTAAASKIIPGATSLSLRNNADSADNLSITDAGLATFRGAIVPSNDLYTVAKTDYFSTSTKAGWSSPSGTIYYKKIGFQVWVIFNISGTSNASSTTFTLPYANNSGEFYFPCLGVDSGTAISTFALGVLGSGSSTATFYSSTAGGGWTSSGTKQINGQFWYFTGS